MKATRFLSVGLLGSALALCVLAAANSWQTTILHANIPAGYEVLLIKPSDTVLTFLGLIECPELEGAQQVAEGMKSRIVNADGKTLAHYPNNFSFRITASLRKTLLIEPTDMLEVSEAPQDFLLKLKFRLKAYEGLQAREIRPESIQIIGVPAEIPYDERVYRVSFNVTDLPVTDRCVLEVLTLDGVRLTKFHFDLL
jgi:hypothetical protein